MGRRRPPVPLFATLCPHVVRVSLLVTLCSCENQKASLGLESRASTRKIAQDEGHEKVTEKQWQACLLLQLA